jgi:hypothetical protein
MPLISVSMLKNMSLPLKSFLSGLATEGLLLAIVALFGEWSPCNPENWISGAWLMLHIPAFYIAQWLHLQAQLAFVDSTMLINVILWTAFWFCVFRLKRFMTLKQSTVSKNQTP